MNGTNQGDEIIVRLDNADGSFVMVSVTEIAKEHNFVIEAGTSLVLRVNAAELVHMRMDRISRLVRLNGE